MSEDKKVPSEVLTMIDLVVNQWDSFTIEVIQSEGSGKSKAWTYGTLTLTETNRPDPESYKIDIAWDENENIEFDHYDGNWESVAELPMHLYFIARQAQIKQGRAASDLFDECQRLKNAAITSEWRPLSVITMEVAERWRTWAFFSKDWSIARLKCLRDPFRLAGEPSDVWQRMLIYEVATSYDVALWDRISCRPIDSEGIPVPWAKVGL